MPARAHEYALVGLGLDQLVIDPLDQVLRDVVRDPLGVDDVHGRPNSVRRRRRKNREWSGNLEHQVCESAHRYHDKGRAHLSTRKFTQIDTGIAVAPRTHQLPGLDVHLDHDAVERTLGALVKDADDMEKFRRETIDEILSKIS